MRTLAMLAVLTAAAGAKGPGFADVFDPFDPSFPDGGDRLQRKKQAFDAALAAQGFGRLVKALKKCEAGLTALDKNLAKKLDAYEDVGAKYWGWRRAYEEDYKKKNHGSMPGDYPVPPGLNSAFLDAEKAYLKAASLKRRERSFHAYVETAGAAALAALADKDRKKAVAALAGGLKARSALPQLQCAAILAGARGDGDAAGALAKAFAAEKHPGVRAALLVARAETQVAEGFADLLGSALKDAAWPVRAAAARAARILRTKDGTALLVAARKGARGRLVDDLDAALHDLSGQPVGDWEAWWGRAADGFAPRPAPAPAADDRENPPRVASAGPVSFLGAASATEHVILCLDGFAELARLQDDVRACLDALPETGTFQLIVYGEAVERFRKKPAPANGTNKKAALAWLAKRDVDAGGDACGGLLDALAAAEGGRNQPPVADTIYFLTLTGPRAGPIRDAGQMAQEVRAANRVLGVRIHAYGRSAGRDAYYLQDIVRQFGGTLAAR